MVKNLAFKVLHVFFIIELAIELHQLVSHGQEHHPPRLDGVVVVLLDDAPCHFEVVLLTTEEIEIRLQVIILDSQGAHWFTWLF